MKHKAKNQYSMTKNTIMVAFLVIATISGWSFLSVISIILICMSILYASKENTILLLIMLAPFESIIQINERKVFFILILLLLLKSIFSKKVIQNKYFSLIPSLVVLVMLEILNEKLLPNIHFSLVALLNLISYLMFFVYIIINIKNLDFSIDALLLSLNISVLLVAFVSFYHYGSISAFIQKSQDSSYVFRLGGDVKELISGAMGIPLYASLAIAANIPYLIYRQNIKLTDKIIPIITVIFSLIIGSLSISRSFILCIAVTLISYVFIYLISRKKTLSGFVFLFITSIVVYVLICPRFMVQEQC